LTSPRGFRLEVTPPIAHLNDPTNATVHSGYDQEEEAAEETVTHSTHTHSTHTDPRNRDDNPLD